VLAGAARTGGPPLRHNPICPSGTILFGKEIFRREWEAAPSKPLRPFWGWSNFPDLHSGMANIESRISNDEPHDPLHTKNATGTPAAPVSFEIHHSSFDIRYCLKIFPIWFRLGRVTGDDLIRQSGDRLSDPPQGQELPERAFEPTHFAFASRI